MVDLNASTTRTGKGKSNLVIKRNVLDDNHAYTFLLNISSAITNASETGYSKLTLNPLCSPTVEFCSLCIVSFTSVTKTGLDGNTLLPCNPVYTNTSYKKAIVALRDFVQVSLNSPCNCLCSQLQLITFHTCKTIFTL